MIEIEFVLRGRSIEIEEMDDLRERAVLEQIARSIAERVGDIRCAKHGAFPRLTASGARVDALNFDVSGCCQDLLTKTAAALS
jgi:hypothetical protein